MRLTNVVWKQHIERMAKRHWRVQGKRVIRNTAAVQICENLKISVIDINEVVKSTENNIVLKDEDNKTIQLAEPLPVFNSTHPLFKRRQCFMHKDNTVLIGGLDQAKIVAKAVQVSEGLPKQLEEKVDRLDTSSMNKFVQKCILASHVFDAQQEKLPHLHDPERPAWKFPRVLGITDKRRSYLTCEKLVQLCNTWSSRNFPLFAINNSRCVVPIEKDEELLQFELTLNMALVSSDPLQKLSSLEDEEKMKSVDLPDIYPTKPTITFEKTHFYEPINVFPVSNISKFCHLHTVICHNNETEIKNLYETAVQDTQLSGRCVLYGFATAVSQARQLFGESKKELPFPIVVQCIQTDGRVFDFCVFQLNTLNFDGVDGTKNIVWILPRMKLFAECNYKDGRPTLEGYDPQVFKYFMAFCTQN